MGYLNLVSNLRESEYDTTVLVVNLRRIGIVMTFILIFVELIVYVEYGFPSGYMLQVVGVYLSILGLLEAYRRTRIGKSLTRAKSGLPGSAFAVLEAVHKGFCRCRQIAEYSRRRYPFSKAEIFEATAILVKRGYLKDSDGSYSTTERADDLL